MALSDDIPYVWVDTCCIDKSSSAELSEAINSMFRWYAKSEVCYAYLDDINGSSYIRELPTARWFTRGWTLQELIAPRNMIFFSKDWEVIGSKESLRKTLGRITTIPSTALSTTPPAYFSVAERMSWIAERETTKAEDLAYALLGLFDVHMPLLYGEGDRAFIRLQEEIMKYSDDQSLFSWVPTKTPLSESLEVVSVFATHPRQFKQMRRIEPSWRIRGETYALTNKGVRFQLLLSPFTPTASPGMQLYLAFLDISISEGNHAYRPGIILHKFAHPGQQYCRVGNVGLVFVYSDELLNTPKQTFYICHKIHSWDAIFIECYFGPYALGELERGNYKTRLADVN